MTESVPPAGEAQFPSPARTEALSDGVFAIAITLLVLTLHQPTPDDVERHGNLLLALAAQWPSYLAYLATFVTLGVTWMNHHAMSAKLRRTDTAFQWWNLVLLLAVSFAPFPTELAATYLSDDLSGPSARLATGVFLSVSLLRPLIWVPLWGHLRHHPELLRPEYDADDARREQRRVVLGCVLYGAGVAVAAFAPVPAILLALGISVFFALTAHTWARGTGPG